MGKICKTVSSIVPALHFFLCFVLLIDASQYQMSLFAGFLYLSEVYRPRESSSLNDKAAVCESSDIITGPDRKSATASTLNALPVVCSCGELG